MKIRIALILAALAAVPASRSAAAGKAPGYSGFVALRCPLWDSVTGTVHDAGLVELAGEMRLTGVVPRLTPWVAGEYTLGQPKGYALENKVKGGFDFQISRRWTFFSYYDYRPITERSRFFVGIKTPFHGTF